jgi:hypothetical protein
MRNHPPPFIVRDDVRDGRSTICISITFRLHFIAASIVDNPLCVTSLKTFTPSCHQLRNTTIQLNDRKGNLQVI